MSGDLNTASDVRLLVESFYAEVRKDDLISHFFNDVVEIDWGLHLPRICQFWESILFGTASYKGNPMIKHLNLNTKVELTAEHFERWILLWEKHVNLQFEGENAELAKQRARSLKDLMLFKIEQQRIL